MVESEEMILDDSKSLKARIFMGIFLFLPFISVLINLAFRHQPIDGVINWPLWSIHLGGGVVGQLIMFWLAIDHNPLKWWKVVMGTTIRVNSERIGDLTSEDIHEWLDATISRPYVEINSLSYRFLFKRDATMFKMAWG